MATSKDLLFVDPDSEINPFLLKGGKEENSKKPCPPNIVRIEQPSVLSRVKNFLPVMAAANERLEKEMSNNAADAFDIESIKEDEQYVEMNIGLYEKGNDYSSNDGSDSDEERICRMLGEVNETNMKLTTEEKSTGPKMITEISKLKKKTANTRLTKKAVTRRRKKKSK